MATNYARRGLQRWRLPCCVVLWIFAESLIPLDLALSSLAANLRREITDTRECTHLHLLHLISNVDRPKVNRLVFNDSGGVSNSRVTTETDSFWWSTLNILWVHSLVARTQKIDIICIKRERAAKKHWGLINSASFGAARIQRRNSSYLPSLPCSPTSGVNVKFHFNVFIVSFALSHITVHILVYSILYAAKQQVDIPALSNLLSAIFLFVRLFIVSCCTHAF